MGIVKVSDRLHQAAKRMAKAMNRSVNAQTEHWMRIGKIVEENPAIYQQVHPMLLKIIATKKKGDD